MAQAGNCEALRSDIEVRIRSAGVVNPNVTVTDIAEPTRGKVVGSCERGSRKIVYTPGTSPSTAAPASGSSSGSGSIQRTKSEPILTECRDGTMSVGGTCGR